MDPQLRLLLEVSYEAILDAGIYSYIFLHYAITLLCYLVICYWYALF